MLHRVASTYTKTPLSITFQRPTKSLEAEHLQLPSKRSSLPFRNFSTKQRNPDVLPTLASRYSKLVASKVVHHSNRFAETIRSSRVRKRKSPRMATTSSDGEDISNRTQQSPLAAQREKAQGLQPRKGGFFTLGYKEAVSQWVSPNVATLAAASFSLDSFIHPQHIRSLFQFNHVAFLLDQNTTHSMFADCPSSTTVLSYDFKTL